jgi:hypothetical protein
MKVNVTAQDIRAGEVNNCERCPVALALSRKFPDYAFVVLAYAIEAHLKQSKNLRQREPLAHIPLPLAVERLIGRFDAGLLIKPFSFDL